jgi:predicted peptidase
MVEALKKHGGTPKFTVYPEAEHDSWTETYANPELYEWLLQQKRTAKKAESPK